MKNCSKVCRWGAHRVKRSTGDGTGLGKKMNLALEMLSSSCLQDVTQPVERQNSSLDGSFINVLREMHIFFSYTLSFLFSPLHFIYI